MSMLQSIFGGATPRTTKRTVTLHYTNWCGHCKVMKPIYAQVSVDLPQINFLLVDEDIAHTPGIKGYPTITMVTELGELRTYRGPPNRETLRVWALA